jgi:hypothetical protein
LKLVLSGVELYFVSEKLRRELIIIDDDDDEIIPDTAGTTTPCFVVTCRQHCLAIT